MLETAKNIWESLKKYFREQSTTEKKKLSEMTPKEKVDYIWEYYKLHIIGITVVLFIAASIINSIMNPPVPQYAGIAFYEVFLGEDFEDTFINKLTKELIDDPTKYQIYSHMLLAGGDPTAEMAIVQKLMAMIMVQEIDVIITTENFMEAFIYEGFFMDLETAGVSVPREIQVMGVTSDSRARKAYGVNLGNSKILNDMGIRADMLYAGIVVNTEVLDRAVNIFNLIVEG